MSYILIVIYLREENLHMILTVIRFELPHATIRVHMTLDRFRLCSRYMIGWNSLRVLSGVVSLLKRSIISYKIMVGDCFWYGRHIDAPKEG